MQYPKLQASSTANQPDLRKIGANPNFWYPIALPKNLKKGKALGVSFAGEPIVRTEGGKIYALEDRCAHRQIPLSLGIVVGESLQCCYHGWVYNEHGNFRTFAPLSEQLRGAALYGHRFRHLPQPLARTTESGKNGIEKLRGETLNVWTDPVLAHAAGSVGFVEMHPPA
jgi:nitrite reductase/ring-hydroxylating ferredoxin subunit